LCLFGNFVAKMCWNESLHILEAMYSLNFACKFMIRKTILVNRVVFFLCKSLRLLLYWISGIRTVIYNLMFDGIYNKSEIIFWINLVLSSKWDWLMLELRLYIQHFHFQLHCCMFFAYVCGFYIFCFGWSFWMNR
jgi:hypothetical protein